MHETGGGWSVGPLAAYGQDALALAGGRGAAGGGGGVREAFVPLQWQMEQHDFRPVDASKCGVAWRNPLAQQGCGAAVRVRDMVKTAKWMQYPAARSLDGYVVNG